MIWAAEIGLVILAIVAITMLANAGRSAGKLHDVAEERIAAYMATLRRTGENRELAEMTDTELHDVLGAAMRRLSTARSRKFLILIFGAIATLLASIVFGVEEGWRAFAATFAVGAIALFGLERALERMTRAPIEAQGLDVDRLRLD